MRTARRRWYFSKARESASRSPVRACSSKVNVDVGESVKEKEPGLWNIIGQFSVEWIGGVRVQGGVQREMRPPWFAVWLLRAAEWIVPRRVRAEWRTLWTARLENLWILAGRGELILDAPTETVRLCQDAVAGAFWSRFERPKVL